MTTPPEVPPFVPMRLVACERFRPWCEDDFVCHDCGNFLDEHDADS